MAPLQRAMIADEVIQHARHRRRPLMANDEAVIRAVVDTTLDKLAADGVPIEPEKLVPFFVAAIGGLEFEMPKRGGFEIRMRPPEADDAS